MRRGFFDEARPNQYAAFPGALAFAVVVALRWQEASDSRLPRKRVAKAYPPLRVDKRCLHALERESTGFELAAGTPRGAPERPVSVGMKRREKREN
jgi:hypothetical protein